MNYWLDLFSGTTWEHFKRAGARETGFRSRMRKNVARVQPGDILLCYMTGVMRWVGALEVVAHLPGKSKVWEDFPVALEVKPLIMLEAETGLPMKELEGRVWFYEGPAQQGRFKGFVRGSPNLFKRKEDGELILKLLREAERNPVRRPVDPVKLARKPLFKVRSKKGRKTVQTLISIPEKEEATEPVIGAETEVVEKAATAHTSIQYLLATLGNEMGLNIWVARNDRGRIVGGKPLGELAGMVDELPTQFNKATNKTIELIDMLWLKGNSIAAAFEIESTTLIYSGLLRMSDLLALQPNLNIKLYIVAAEDRKAKVRDEILRPTFMLRERPLSEVCGFLSISGLLEKIGALRKLGLVTSLKPDFLERLAEYFKTED